MRTKRCLGYWLVWAGVFVTASAANAGDYFVASNDNDSCPGTSERPFATVACAQQAVRAVLAGCGAMFAAESGVKTPQPDRPRKDVRILVAFDSLRGNTQRMADAVAEGAKQVTAQVAIKRVQEVSKEDLLAADGIILGCPTYYANIPGSMKVVLDDWSWKMKVDFTDKVGGAFATGGGHTGGKEHTVISLLLFMINIRMVVAGPLYQDAEGEDLWAELGATAATGPVDPGLSESELDGARRVGQRVASLARKMRGP